MINLDNGNETVKISSRNIQDRVDDFPKPFSNLRYGATRKIDVTEDKIQKTSSNIKCGTTRSAQDSEDDVEDTYYSNYFFEYKDNAISKKNECYATINV